MSCEDNNDDNTKNIQFTIKNEEGNNTYKNLNFNNNTILSPQTIYDHLNLSDLSCDWLKMGIIDINFTSPIKEIKNLDFSTTDILQQSSESITVKHNIQSIPFFLYHLPNLQILNLSDNNISETTFIPNMDGGGGTEINNLSLINNSLLEEIYLHNTKENIEKFNKNTNADITDKSLTKNNIITIPDNIFGLTNLKVLNLSRNEITTIPENINKLTNLQELDLSHNSITNFPDFRQNLQLKKLLLNNNKIRDNKFITNLELLLGVIKDDQLELNISHNRLENDFPNLSNQLVSKLKEFNVEYNYFKGTISCLMISEFGYDNETQYREDGTNITLKTDPEKCIVSDDIENKLLYRPEVNYYYDSSVHDRKYTNKRLDMPTINLDRSKKNNLWSLMHILNLVCGIVILFLINKID